MKEKILLDFAILFSIIGLMAIFFLSDNIEENNTKINKLPDERVHIKGDIIKIEQENNENYVIVSEFYKVKISNDTLDIIKANAHIKKIRITARKINDTLVCEKVFFD